MAKFCTFCGRALNEGEICSCQNNVNTANNQTQQVPQTNTNVQNNYQQPTPNFAEQMSRMKKSSKTVPIGQTVAGGLLAVFGLMCSGFDWGYISLAAAFGFLWTGIFGLLKKD